MPAPAAFVLDFNGTISDDEPLLEEIYRALFAGHRARPVARALPRRVRRALGSRDHRRRASRSRAAPARPGWPARLEAEHTARYLEGVRATSPVTAGAEAFVRAAAARVPVAIASGAARETIDAALAPTGLAAALHRDRVERGRDARQARPGGLPARPRAARRRARAGSPVRPGDRLGGRGRQLRRARSARAAGLRVVALRTPAYDPELAPADLVADRLDETLVERLFRHDRARTA